MNFKALITTFVLGSSTMASADSVTLSGSVSVSLGGSTHTHPAPLPAPAPAPVIVRDHRVEQDPCDTHVVTPAPAPVVVQPPAPRPVYQPPAPVVVRPPQPMPPTWSDYSWQPRNIRLEGNASIYVGTMGQSSLKYRPAAWQRGLQIRNQAWFEMTEATRIENNRLIVGVNDTGYYRGLKIESLGRGSDISFVRIDFKDRFGRKSYQLVRLNQHLDRNHSSLTIDLDGNYRQISRITVYGKTDRGSAIKLLAM